MEILYSAEELGKRILFLYRQEDVPPGQMLSLQNLRILWLNRWHSPTDLTKGLEWLVEQGYMEKGEMEITGFVLTESGFAFI